MAIFDRMLFPNERISGYRVQVLIVFDLKRPEFDTLALQDWLIVE